MEKTTKYVRLFNIIFPNLQKLYIFELREEIVCGLIHLNSLHNITENILSDFVNRYSGFIVESPDYKNGYVSYDITFYSETSSNCYLVINNTRYYIGEQFFTGTPNDVDEKGMCFLFYWSLCRMAVDGVTLPFITTHTQKGQTFEKTDIVFDWNELHDYYVAYKVQEIKDVIDAHVL